MADIIKMDYPLMEAMARAFADGSERLEDTISEMNAVAGMIADGALIGQGGDAFEEAIRGTLIPKIQRLQEKFNELQQDILSAVETMKGTDSSVRGFVG